MAIIGHEQKYKISVLVVQIATTKNPQTKQFKNNRNLFVTFQGLEVQDQGTASWVAVKVFF